MHIPPSYVTAGSATPASTHTSSIILLNGLSWFSKETGDGDSGGGGGGGGGISYPENWSSLIGIVTAIVGNVLISFALNMQRYAHIRLDREWQEKERQRKRRNASGLSLNRLNEEVTKFGGRSKDQQQQQQHGNGTADQTHAPDANIFEATESDPLVANSRSQSRPGVERGDSAGSGPDEEVYKQKSYLKSPYWWFGIILMTVGEAGNFLAYGFAPASIVSPLGVVALISNCIIAPFMLKEPFRKRDALGVIIAVGGAVTVVLSANDNNPKLGPGEIWDLIRRWEFETYLGITVGVIIVLMGASNKYGDKNILIDLGLVGLFGGYTALSTKGVASLLSYTLWRAITFPVFYLLVTILVGTAVMQIKYVNRALQRFDATQVIPVQFVLFTLSVIGGSAVLYRDFERTSAQDAGKFIGGCALTFFGVWLITSGRPPQHNEEDDEPDHDAMYLAGERYTDDVDDTGDDIAQSTRSTSRPLSPPINIPSRYRDDDSRPSTPTIVVIPDPVTPPNPVRSVSADIMSSLVANPWTQPNEPEDRTPSLNRHTSTPVLPSEAAPLPLASTSDPELGLPWTPTRGKSQTDMPTTPGSQLRRLRTVDRPQGTRNSIAGPLLASPLSTSLSTMVQDLKRGASVRYRDPDDSIRRRGSVLGLGSSSHDAAAAATAVDDGAMMGGGTTTSEPLSRRQTRDSQAGPSEGAVTARTGRGRSLSGTLSELWRGLGGRGSREDIRGE
ncbi:magnesium transporter NIPA-domain-containing protein, partial [Bipolaris maydis]